MKSPTSTPSVMVTLSVFLSQSFPQCDVLVTLSVFLSQSFPQCDVLVTLSVFLSQSFPQCDGYLVNFSKTVFLPNNQICSCHIYLVKNRFTNRVLLYC
jgi:hypothetical protein